MNNILIYSENTLFREYIVGLLEDNKSVGAVDGVCQACSSKDDNEYAKYQYFFVDLFSRRFNEQFLKRIIKFSDVANIVMFTTKENNILNYFNSVYGVKHFIYSDDTHSNIIKDINEILSKDCGCGSEKIRGALTSRECEILKYISKGNTSKEIAEKLCISKNTVDTHRNKMLQKLNLANSASLVHYAFKSGMV